MESINPLSNSQAGPKMQWPSGPSARLMLAILVGLPLLLCIAFWLSGERTTLSLGLSMTGYLVGASLILRLMARGFPHPQLGACNYVTLLRFLLSAALLAPLAGAGHAQWAIFGIALFAVSLDGVDGWLARREGQVSDFGARFDMEVDAALALILALNLMLSGITGPVVLLVGLPRYVFVAAAYRFPWLARPLPDRFSRKVVCVLQLVILIGLQLPIIPAYLVGPCVALALIALAWSFGRDVAWLWRTRA